MDGPLRITMNLAKVLRVLLEDPTARFYGLEIGRAAGLTGGSLYPVLLKLEQAGVLASNWEDVDPSEVGRPRRRLYWLTSDGAEYGTRVLREAQQSVTPRRSPTLRRSLTPRRSPSSVFPAPGGATA